MTHAYSPQLASDHFFSSFFLDNLVAYITTPSVLQEGGEPAFASGVPAPPPAVQPAPPAVRPASGRRLPGPCRHLPSGETPSGDYLLSVSHTISSLDFVLSFFFFFFFSFFFG